MARPLTPATMPGNRPESFSHHERKSGEIEVRHFGTLAMTLRGHPSEAVDAVVGGVRAP